MHIVRNNLFINYCQKIEILLFHPSLTWLNSNFQKCFFISGVNSSGFFYNILISFCEKNLSFFYKVVHEKYFLACFGRDFFLQGWSINSMSKSTGWSFSTTWSNTSINLFSLVQTCLEFREMRRSLILLMTGQVQIGSIEGLSRF